MGNYLDQTWLAYALDGEGDARQAGDGLARVGRHYQGLYPEALVRDDCGDRSMGMALWQRPNERLRWPLWSQGERACVASTSPLTGWRGLVGGADMAPAPARLGELLLSRPHAVPSLDPPFVVAVYTAERMVFANDLVGAGRLFQLRWDGGSVWSNRLGALHVFAGLEPRADERAWGVLAAAGWFLGELTALEGARQLRPASVVEVSREGRSFSVSEGRDLEALDELVKPRRKLLRRSARDAARGARALLSDVAAAWDCPLDVDLSGGRDSRISAAAAIATGADIELRTQDLEHGELEVVEQLVKKAAGNTSWRVEPAESDPADPLLERAGNLHLAHDGMRNPQSLLRTPFPLPHPPRTRPIVSGHGGELGHGFYYGSAKGLARIHEGGDAAVLERLIDVARKRRQAAVGAGYAEYEEQVRATVGEGAELGLSGPNLLEYFYLSQRLANRSGITTRNDRWSACSTLAFVRSCFDLKPEQRLESKMHHLVIRELLPEWSDVPFFEAEPAPLRETKQVRIWEKPGHAEEVAAVISDDASWHASFSPDVVQGMWRDALDGKARNFFEPTFTRIVWRASFERHLRTLQAAAKSHP